MGVYGTFPGDQTSAYEYGGMEHVEFFWEFMGNPIRICGNIMKNMALLMAICSSVIQFAETFPEHVHDVHIIFMAIFARHVYHGNILWGCMIHHKYHVRIWDQLEKSAGHLGRNPGPSQDRLARAITGEVDVDVRSCCRVTFIKPFRSRKIAFARSRPLHAGQSQIPP